MTLSFTHLAGSDRRKETTMDLRTHARHWLLVVGLLVMGSAVAQPRTATAVAPFTGTLQKIYEIGVIRIGHRENSPPFAFLDAQRRPIGYSLDLCDVVVEQVGEHVHQSLRVEYVPVSPTNRFDLVKSGAVDLECGSTTASAERRTAFDFSPVIFVTGTKLLVKRGSGIRSLRDLQGKTVVLTSGTVHADTVPRLAQRRRWPSRSCCARPRRVLQDPGRRQSGRLRQRRHSALWSDRSPQCRQRLPRGGRLPHVR
jgi:hypothetical protein